VSFISLLKNTLSNNKDKRLDVLSSGLLLISPITLLIYGLSS